MLYLIRHSTTVQNPDVSSHTWVLSADGRERARQLARGLSEQPPLDGVYTSIEPKALGTGKILAEELGVACQTFDGLHEHERHTAPFFPTQAEFQAAIARLFACPDELVFGEETAAQASARFDAAIHQIGQRHPSGDIAIVTHGTVLSLFIARHNPAIDVFEFWRQLTMPDCYVVDRLGWRLQSRIAIAPP
jgi:broad specificity phosphatase PhoE